MSDAKVALIGLGAMTQRVHLPSLASFPDVSIVGACDLDRQRLDSVADRYGIEAATPTTGRWWRTPRPTGCTRSGSLT